MRIAYPPCPKIALPAIRLAILALLVIPASAKDAETARIEFVDTKGKEVSFETLKGKTLGFYFSAHWCPPCRQFTPTLVDFRNEHVEDFEVVFVSFDHSEAEKKNYMREANMSWLTVPGAKNREAEMLAQIFGVKGYPTLIIIDPNGKVITNDGRSDVMLSPDTAIEKWKAASTSFSTQEES